MSPSSGRSTAAEVLLAAGAWPALRDALADASPGLKGEVFELLVREYLRLDARYDFTEVWSTHGEVPKSVLKDLNLFGRDVTGIDLVARTRQGRYWAVQCKYHQEEAWSLSRKEATGLIAGRGRARGGFELGLICTTANSRSPNLAGEPHLEFLMGDVWRGLDAAFFARLHAHLRGAAPQPLERKQPRPHQVEALEAITRYFSANARGKVIMPCATGKSLVGFWAAEQLGAKRVLVAVPNLSLVRQLLKDWTEQSLAAGRRPAWAVVCSDDSVADTTSARDLGVKLDTDPKEVAAWLRETKGSDRSVVFTTYQSGKVLAQAAKLAGVTFDLGIFDEAHRTAGREGAPFAYLLDEKNLSVERRVFMTATPRIFKGKSRDDIISMDDPAQFGGDAYRMTFLQAMERDIIPNLTIVAVTVASAEVERILKNKYFLRLKREYGDDVIRSEELVAALALRKAMQKYGIRRSLGFNSSRKRCHRAGDIQRLLTEVLPAYGALDVFHVDGEMTSAERDSELRAFETSTHALMTNVRVFVEGVDCPSMDAVLFADPKQSIIDIVQGVGRALRPFKGKTAGYAIIPTVIDDQGVPTDAAYAQLVRVACALGSEDEVILDYFAAVAQGKPWTGASVFEVLGDVEAGIQVDLKKVNRAVAVRTYERTVDFLSFEQAQEFARKLGLKSAPEWKAYSARGEKPANIPGAPNWVYRTQGWSGWGQWLGTGHVATGGRKILPFREARKLAQALGLDSSKAWASYCRSGEKPAELPGRPSVVYANDGWRGWSDWLGRETRNGRTWMRFSDARRLVSKLGLRTQRQWREYCRSGRIPVGIPHHPNTAYAGSGWVAWWDWLGAGQRRGAWRTFAASRRWARTLKLESATKWHELRAAGRILSDIPGTPSVVYAGKGWKNWADFLGSPHERDIEFLPFDEAKQWARAQSIRSGAEWVQVSKSGRRPRNIPSAPDRKYEKSGWRGWGDFLGTGRVRNSEKRFLAFEEARDLVRKMGLATFAEWKAYCRSAGRRDDIPSNPSRTYADQWVDLADWLGTGSTRSSQSRSKR